MMTPNRPTPASVSAFCAGQGRMVLTGAIDAAEQDRQ
jgi:hypothetical protein